MCSAKFQGSLNVLVPTWLAWVRANFLLATQVSVVDLVGDLKNEDHILRFPGLSLIWVEMSLKTGLCEDCLDICK